MAEAHERWIKEMMAEVDPVVISGLLTQVGHVKESAQRHLSEDD